MGTVWVAEDTLLARKVAVKTLHPELSVDEAVRERFRNEAISAAGLAHPGIVTTYDTGEDDGTAYIVMELVEGPNLRVLLDERGPLEVPEALRIARGVALALEVAHQAGIVHRDVKPANVLVPPVGPVKVTDFGIAKASGSGDLTGAGTIIGTARYLAPEQVRGEPADGRADVYAVGLLLHEMIAGSLPFRGDTEMQTALSRLSVVPEPLPAGTPAAVASIVARCLALDPDDRWPSAHVLAGALDAVMRGDAVDAGRTTDATISPVRAVPTPPLPQERPGPRPQPARPQPARPQSARRGAAWPWAILGAVVLGLGAGGGYLIIQELSKKGAGGGGDIPVKIVEANDFDPLGGDGEHSDEAQFAIDANAATEWSTETYRSQDLGGKAGVGLVVVFATAADISSIEVDAGGSDWSAEIYAADRPADSLAGWGSPVASGDNLGTSATFDVGSRSAGAILIWITRVPESGRLDIVEVRVA